MRKFLILAAVLLASCGGNVGDKIRVMEPLGWRVESLTKVVVECTIENSSCHAVRISDGRFRLHTATGDVATVLLNEEVKASRRSVTELEVPLRMRFRDPLALLSLPSGLMVSGEVKVRIGPVRKKIRIENEPVSEFIDNLAR